MPNYLDRNYQIVSTNRFVVDSPRFWRSEFHPRFKDIFTQGEFEQVLIDVNNNQSFPLPAAQIAQIAAYLFRWFAGSRFSQIPERNPRSPEQFLADMYFILSDVLPQITFTDYQLSDDDFNVVGKRGQTGKNDTSKLNVSEDFTLKTVMDTAANILSNQDIGHQATTSVENTDEETDQNTKTVDDVFLSPQNQGVIPTTANTRGEGVNGITMANGAAYTTSTENVNVGDSTVGKSNTSGATTQADARHQQNNDITTDHSNENTSNEGQGVEQTLNKTDVYEENLNFNRADMLLNFSELTQNMLWRKILGYLQRWVLEGGIATSDTNYVGLRYYD